MKICPKICYSNIVLLQIFSPSKHFLVLIFRIGARTRGVNSSTRWGTRGVNSSTRWEGELKSAAVNICKCEGIISMVL